jgi:hypothetical protein
VPDRCLGAAGLLQKSAVTNLALEVDTSAWRPDPDGLVNLATDELYSAVEYQDLLGRVEVVRMPVGDLKLRTMEFQDAKNPNLRIFGGYFFIANGRITPAPEGVKLMAFNPRERFAYYCKVQLTSVSHHVTQERFLELSADLLKELLPELMRCLPDWSEVERRGRTATPAGLRENM